MKQIRLVMQQNFDIEVGEFSFSPISLHTLKDTYFLLSCGPLNMDGVYPVELEY